MSPAAIFASDLIAITLLSALYFSRHHRRDMVLAYVGLNVGVLAVAAAFTHGTVAAGLGLGLFGVLSIIRLRSFELTHEEVAYYFAALTMGLLGGVTLDPSWTGPALMGALLAAFVIADHPRLLQRYRHQVLTLDAAYTDEGQLRDRLASLLGAEIKRVQVRKLDLVNDTTVVDVRYRLHDEPGATTPAGVAAGAGWQGR